MQTPRLKLDNKILNISNDLSPLLFIGHKEETVSKFTVPEYDVIFDKISNIEIGVSRVSTVQPRIMQKRTRNFPRGSTRDFCAEIESAGRADGKQEIKNGLLVNCSCVHYFL